MRISDERYDRDMRRMELAARMLRLGARTRTVENWTTMRMKRLRGFYRSYDLMGSHRSTPLFGQSPKNVAKLWKSAVTRCEATVLAGFLRQFGVLPARFGEASSLHLAELSRGERLCEAMEEFRALCPTSPLTLEHAVMLLTEWVRGVEFQVMRCPECEGLMIQDLLKVGEVNCAFCGYEKHSGVAHFAVKTTKADMRMGNRDQAEGAADDRPKGKQTRLF